jgi:hypothetical protein
MSCSICWEKLLFIGNAAIVCVAVADMMRVLAAINDTRVQETFEQSIQKQRRNRSSFYRLVVVTKQYEILR